MLILDFYEKYPSWKCLFFSLLTSHLSRGYNTINRQAKKGFFFGFVEILLKFQRIWQTTGRKSRKSAFFLHLLPSLR